MLLDEATVANLELFESQAGGKKHTLFNILNAILGVPLEIRANLLQASLARLIFIKLENFKIPRFLGSLLLILLSFFILTVFSVVV